jgi:thioesterase domain-containing protein
MDKLQPLLTIAEEMVAHYLEKVRQVQPQGPYLLLGWSTGGIIAFEMARQLLAQQQAVAFLGILDASAIPDSLTQAADDTTFLSLFLRNIFGTSTLDFASLEKHYRQLTSIDEQLIYVLTEVKKVGLLAPGISQEEFTHLFKIFRANVEAVLNYHPLPYPGKVQLYRAAEQQREPAIPPDLGWQTLVTGKLELILTGGNHHTMLKEPQVGSLAERIKTAIEMLILTSRPPSL